MGEGTPPRPAVVATRAEVLAAREALDAELVRLEASARAAVDIPAKIRRNPVKTAGIAAGVGFVAVGGPRKLFRRARRAVLGPQEPLPTTMLPDEIEKSLKRLGGDGVRVRALLEREFADYLRTTAKARRDRSIPDALSATLIVAARPFLIAYARKLAGQAFSPDAPGFGAQMERIRARRAAGTLTESDLADVSEEPPIGI